MRRPAFVGLWRHPDFLRLWAGETVSLLGTLIGRIALTFTAILWLEASPFEVALLGICEMAPGLVVGIAAGVWVDRLPRRVVMIWSDLGRSAVLVTVPLMALGGWLTIWQVLAVAIARATLDIFFETAYQAYLPGLVGRARVLEGNSKLTATASAAEVGGFGVAGWLIQIFTAPGAVLVDAASFVGSAWAVWRIKAPEPRSASPEERVPFWRSAREGLGAVGRDPVLRGLITALGAISLPSGMFSAVFLLFVTRELDIGPGLQGSIYAIGGVTSLLGAWLAARSAAWHLGRSLVVASTVRWAGMMFPAAAAGPMAVRGSLMVANQLVTDPAWAYYEIQETSIRQASAPAELLGRVTATFRVVDYGVGLLGLGLGGLLAEAFGLRAAIVVAVLTGMAGVAPLLAPSLIRLRRLPSTS